MYTLLRQVAATEFKATNEGASIIFPWSLTKSFKKCSAIFNVETSWHYPSSKFSCVHRTGVLPQRLVAAAVQTKRLVAAAVQTKRLVAAAVQTKWLVAAAVQTKWLVAAAVKTKWLVAAVVKTKWLVAAAVKTKWLVAAAVKTKWLVTAAVKTKWLVAAAVKTKWLVAARERLVAAIGDQLKVKNKFETEKYVCMKNNTLDKFSKKRLINK